MTQEMKPFPLTLQLGMKRFHGHVFLAPQRLYFVCGKQGGALTAAIGQGLGGVVGGAIAAIGNTGPKDAPTAVDEPSLRDAVAKNEGSLVMEAGQIETIKQTWFTRLIKFNGKTYGLPSGLNSDLKSALGAWAKQYSVKTKGLPS